MMTNSTCDPTEPDEATLARAKQRGVNLDALRENLKLTPEQRLLKHMAALRLTMSRPGKDDADNADDDLDAAIARQNA